MRLVKKPVPLENQRYPTTEAEIVRKLECSTKEGRLILYCDEVNFTKHTNKDKDWARMHFNIELEQKTAFTKFKAVIVAMSYENGVSDWMIFDQAVRKEDFLDFLQCLKAKYGKRSIAIFLDNLGAHRANLIEENAAELDIQLIFNISDSPWYQPIEGVFAEVKAHFKKLKLRKILHGRDFDIEEAIAAALAHVPVGHVQSHIEHCSRALRAKAV